jgi:phosphodiesterase/alkaline phosphatase D-like protein
MTFAVDRRTLLKGAGLGAVAAVLPLRTFDAEAAVAPARNGVFGYGVASGDPTHGSFIIWTRATPPTPRGEPIASPGSGRGAPILVRWQVATDPDFRRVVAGAVVKTDASRDHTVKVDVGGLEPYTRYWYRFIAAGQVSPVGQTQTAPDEPGVLHALRFALVSCSNYTGGYFTPYRAIAKRDDLDFVLHVGDYLYEYGNGDDRYGPEGLVGKRDMDPATEIVERRDYRLRHALHKADPDLAAAHAAHPWITIFDDHEVANNAWATGAENHRAGEGDFLRRRRVAYQTYLEWMPFRLPSQAQDVPHRGTRFFKSFRFGTLADLSVLETRQNRSKQVDVAPFTTTGGGFIPDGVPAVDAQLADPTRHLPEPEQMAWLKANLQKKSGWHLVANQVILTPVRFPGALLQAPVPTLLNSDQWDGYQADQAEVIAGLRAAKGDPVVLTGDIHSSWATDIVVDRSRPAYESAGVEFVCPSVTSDGFYEIFGGGTSATAVPVTATVDAAAAAVQATNPWVRYLDGIGHGFTVIDVTPQRVQADYYLTPRPTPAVPDPRVVPTIEPVRAASWRSLAGSRRVTKAPAPIGARSDGPR